MPKVQEAPVTNTSPALGGVGSPPELDTAKIETPEKPGRRTPVAPERGQHSHAYGEGASTTQNKTVGGAAGAQMRARTTKRASDLAMEQLAVALRLAGDKALAKVQADVHIPGGRSAGEAFNRELYGPRSPLSKAKNLQVTSMVTKEGAVAVIGIAIAVTKLLNELVPELTKLVGHLKELWAKIRNKDAKVEIGGQTYTLEEAMKLDPQALAATLAQGKAA